MTSQPVIKLSNGLSIPQLGLGVYKVLEDEVYDKAENACDFSRGCSRLCF